MAGHCADDRSARGERLVLSPVRFQLPRFAWNTAADAAWNEAGDELATVSTRRNEKALWILIRF